MKLRFSIRDLLWLTLVAALAVGWWIDHRKIAKCEAFMETHARFVKWQQPDMWGDDPMTWDDFLHLHFLVRERLKETEQKVKDLQEAGK